MFDGKFAFGIGLKGTSAMRQNGMVGKYMRGGMPGSTDTFLALQEHEKEYHSEYGGEPIVINGAQKPAATKAYIHGGHSNNLPQGLSVRCSSVFSANYRFDERSYNLAMYS